MAISRRFFLLLALLAALPARPALAAAVPPPAGGAGGAQQQQQQPPAGQQGSPSSSAPPLNDCPDCGKVGVTNVPESGGKSAAVSASSVGLPANVDLQEDVLGVLPQRQAPLAEFTNRALQATGLASMLEGNDDGGWTLFAPTGDAWQRFLRFASPKKSEEDLLRDPSLPRLLLHHIAEGAFDPQTLYDAGVLPKEKRPAGYLPPPVANHSGSGLFGELVMKDGQTLAVSFSAQCAPCLGHGAGPFSTTAAAVSRVKTRNGVVYFVDQVLIPATLCEAFSTLNAWQCCGGCDGCRVACPAAGQRPAGAAGGAGRGTGPGAVIVDRACQAFCAGEMEEDVVADKGAASANKTAMSARFAAPKLPTASAQTAAVTTVGGLGEAAAAGPGGAAMKAAIPPFAATTGGLLGGGAGGG